MNCMKCGKETQSDQIFCTECLAIMEKYPVKPGAVVQIPAQPPKKQQHHRRPVLSAEEQVKRLTRRVHTLTLTVILTCTIAIFFALMAFDILEKYNMESLLGRNYSVVGEAETEKNGAAVTTSPLH